jgi:hypothetical protein
MNKPIVRRLAPVFAVLVAVLLIPALSIAQGTPPFIPHPLEGRDKCLACHETGVAGAPQIPDDHAGRTNDMCQTCHQPAPATEASPAVEVTTSETMTETVPAAESPTPEVTPTRAGPPPIPHSLEGRDNCLACHETGVAGAPQIPDDHSGRTNDMCQTCHQPAPATEASPAIEPTTSVTATQTVPTAESPTPEVTPTPAGPLPVPHSLEGRENCLECHTSPEATMVLEEGPPAIPHPLIGRENCLACHQEGVGGAPQIPEDHAGRTSDICQACHQPSQVPAPSTPTPPTEPIPTPIAYPRSEGDNTCFDCHSTLGGKQTEITTQWQRSIHAERGVTCADCHGGNPAASTVDEAMSPDAGYIGAPAKAEIPALCASCHSDVTQMRQYDLATDQYAQYKESIHGIRLAEGDTNVATCFDCHGGHQILKANDPASTVYPVNVPGMCASCHADKDLMAPYDIPTNQYDLYQQSVHGIALLENQDFRAPTCATCHGTHGAAPPGFAEVANVCGSCHTATQDYYLKSTHAKAGEAGPKCVTCHGRYDVSEPSEALYLGAEPRHCGTCHTPDSAPGQVAQSLYDSVTNAAQAYDEAEAAVQEARGLGMLVAPLEGRLREANTNLITARAAQHTLDLNTIHEETDAAQAIASDVKTSADAAVAESIFRRQAMVVAVAVIALVIVALYLLKRELDRRMDEES